MPKKYFDMLVSQVPRLQVQQTKLQAEAGFYSHISDKNRERLQQYWGQILSGSGKIIGDIRDEVLEGTISLEDLKELAPKNVVIATSFEDVEQWIGKQL